MKYNSKMICDICNKEILIDDARIEWLYEKPYGPINIYLCHKSCSAGYNLPKSSVGDIDFNSPIYDEELVFSELKNMKVQYPDLSNKIDKLILKIFVQ